MARKVGYCFVQHYSTYLKYDNNKLNLGNNSLEFSKELFGSPVDYDLNTCHDPFVDFQIVASDSKTNSIQFSVESFRSPFCYGSNSCIPYSTLKSFSLACPSLRAHLSSFVFSSSLFLTKKSSVARSTQRSYGQGGGEQVGSCVFGLSDHVSTSEPPVRPTHQSSHRGLKDVLEFSSGRKRPRGQFPWGRTYKSPALLIPFEPRVVSASGNEA